MSKTPRCPWARSRMQAKDAARLPKASLKLPLLAARRVPIHSGVCIANKGPRLYLEGFIGLM